MRSPGSLALAAAVAGLALAGCGDKVESGLTGLDIRVSFDPAVPVQKLRFSGWTGPLVAFGQVDRPEDDRALSADGEDLIVLLPDSAVDASVFVQVDGIDRGGTPLASAGAAVSIQRGQISSVELRLGEPRFCGDEMVHPNAEECDDGNRLAGDGCTPECLFEAGWTCTTGAPTICSMCGDGECTVGGEDACSCPADCDTAMCGDGLCCPGAGEECTCPADCGEPTCGDDICCNSELASCDADCGFCGDDICEPGAEDVCRCPEDCKPGDGECGDQSCCAQDGESIQSCDQDCCQSPECGDKVCCSNENPTDCPGDCCDANVCGDQVCCPGETAAMCPGDCCGTTPNCGDGACCTEVESQDSCPQDCCSMECGDGRCCPGEVCETDGCQVCPSCDAVGSDCTLCCDECTDGSCNFECPSGCACQFECRDSDIEECRATCGDSGCILECGGQADCTLDCTKSRGGAGCICRGPSCNLLCPNGPPIRCRGGGRPTFVCSEVACP